MKNRGVTGIIPFTYFGGDQKAVGSTFLRVDCLVANAAGFEKWVHGKKYDQLIFQKAYWPEMMKLFPGPKILDLCDPDWVRGEVDIIETGKLVHAITCSSAAMTQLMRSYFPDKIVEHVPDRLDFSIYPPAREKHTGRAKKVVWFGFIHNAHETLEQLLPTITQYGLELTLISNAPYSREDGVLTLNPRHIYYDPCTVYDQLKEADMVLNPRSDRAFYKYKSNNKSLISWNLGLPVAVTPDEVERFLDPEERNREVLEKQRMVKEEYGIERSVLQYMEIIERIYQSGLISG